MTKLFGNLSNDGLEESQDRLGGSRVLETAPYTGTIKAVYAGKSTSSNAQSITVIMETDSNGEYRETFWVTNGKGENFYLDKNDKSKKVPLPGFTIIEDMCLVTTNKSLSEQSAEDKIMNVYDPDQKAEVPKSVPMLVELLGKKVTFGIAKETKNKQKKDSNGIYQDTAESRDENVTDKVFHYPSNLTVVEARKQIQTPAFFPAWVERNNGKTRDRRSIKDGEAQSGRPGMPPKAGESTAKAPSLFG